MKITDTMVLAFLKKGMEYEVKNAEMEFNVPLNAFGFDVDDTESKGITMSCKVENMVVRITQD